MRNIFVWIVALLLCSAAHAQSSIRYRITGDSVTHTLPISGGSIDVGTLSAAAPKVVQIFDVNTANNNPPTSSAIDVTITGSASDGRLIVFIAGADRDTDSPFVDTTTHQLQPPDFRHPRGLVNMPRIEFGDTALRENAILIAWVGNAATTGDCAADVDFGQIWNLDVPHDITGNITAHSRDPDLVLENDNWAIMRIRAGNLISGAITAADTGNHPALTASIHDVIVSPTPTITGGIRGDIIARTGAIGSIISAEAITGNGAAVKIESANGIRQIRIIDESGQVLAKPLVAEVTANYGVADPFTDDRVTGRPDADMAIGLIETAGDLGGDGVGFIHAGNITLVQGQTNLARQAGIIVRGDIKTPIRVDHTISDANIIGHTIKSVHVGWALKGAIIATARGDNGLDTVRIGYPRDFNSNYLYNPIPENYKYRAGVSSVWPGYSRGFVGIHNSGGAAPVDLNPAHLFPNEPQEPVEQLIIEGEHFAAHGADRWYFAPPSDGGAVDAVIRCSHATNIHVANMTQTIHDGTAGIAEVRPRIEVITLKGQLAVGIDPDPAAYGLHDPMRFVGAMANGVIWSGRVEYAYSPGEGGQPGVVGAVSNRNVNDYTTVETSDFVQISCISPQSDVWLEDGHATEDRDWQLLRVFGDVQGEVHVPQVRTYSQIIIEGGLTVADGAIGPDQLLRRCGCSAVKEPESSPCLPGYDDDGSRNYPPTSGPLEVEASPRFNRTSEERANHGRAANGRVLVRTHPLNESGGIGLSGQIILNAANETFLDSGGIDITALRSWQGDVILGDDPPTIPFTFAQSAPQRFAIRPNPPPADLDEALDHAPFYQRQAAGRPPAPSFNVGFGDDLFDGGSIGVVPFALHSTDCSPQNQSQWTVAEHPGSVNEVPAVNFTAWHAWDPVESNQPGELFGRFYGPIIARGNESQPDDVGVRIQHSSDGSFSTFADVTNHFQISLRLNGVNGTLVRDLALRPFCDTTYQNGGLYRVVRNQDAGFPPETNARLACRYSGFVLADEPVVSPFAFYFRFLIKCGVADVASLGGAAVPDGQLTADDIIVFVGAFFAGELAVADVAGLGGTGGPDGQLTADDMVYFLDRFFAGCEPEFPGNPTPCEQNRMAGAGSRTTTSGNPNPPDAGDSERMAVAISALRTALGLTLPDNATPDQMIQAVAEFFSSVPAAAPAGPAPRQ